MTTKPPTNDDPEAPPWDGWRWGEPLTLPEAEALARQHAQGQFLTELERQKRHRQQLEDYLHSAGITLESLEDRYPVYAQGIEYMKEKHLAEMTVDIDPALLEREECESFCGNWSRKRRPDEWQAAYAECLRLNCDKKPTIILPASLR